MKKLKSAMAAFLAVVIVALMLVPMSAISASARRAPDGLMGDLDGDGVITSADALMILRAAVGLITLDDDLLALADINHDGYITSADALDTLVASLGESDSKNADFSSHDMTPIYMEVLRLCNVERRKQGLKDLEYEDALQPAADKRAKEIVTVRDHKRPDGSDYYTALDEIGYLTLASGENCAFGKKTAAAVVEAWLNSPGHRANILNPDYTHMCVSLYLTRDAEYEDYWEQLFVKKSKNFENETAVEDQILGAINAQRNSWGMRSLNMNETLRSICETRADELLILNDSIRPDGTKCSDMLRAYGIPFASTKQLIFCGQQNADEIMDYLVSSNSAVFNGNYADIGIGHAYKENDDMGHYWVIVLVEYF